MYVSAETLEYALSRIIRDTGAGIGTRLPFALFESAWTDTGLRFADLRDALRELVECNVLEACEVDGALAFELTDRGYQRAHQVVPAPSGIAARLVSAWTMFRARSRPWQPASGLRHGRREGERVT